MKTSALVVATIAVLPRAAVAQEGGGGLFAVDIGLSVWTIVVFLVVLWVLSKYGFGPILRLLESRESGIQSAIDEASRQREEAAALLEEHKNQLAEARRQAQELVAEGREAGQRLRAEIEDKEREESERIIERARGEIEREREQAIAALRRESVDLALAAAAQVLHRELDEDSDRALVEDYLKGLSRPPAEA